MVEPVPMVREIIPGCRMIVLGPVDEIVAPSVARSAAVFNAVFCKVTKLPALTEAKEPLAPEKVAAPKVAWV